MQIVFGALSPSLAKQIDEAGYTVDRLWMDALERDSEAITRLLIRGYCPGSAAERMRKSIIKRIEIELLSVDQK